MSHDDEMVMLFVAVVCFVCGVGIGLAFGLWLW